jgi:hypothetical protein
MDKEQAGLNLPLGLGLARILERDRYVAHAQLHGRMGRKAKAFDEKLAAVLVTETPILAHRLGRLREEDHAEKEHSRARD